MSNTLHLTPGDKFIVFLSWGGGREGSCYSGGSFLLSYKTFNERSSLQTDKGENRDHNSMYHITGNGSGFHINDIISNNLR